MSATSGPSGARKGVTVTFPRLTGRAIIPISQHLRNVRSNNNSTDESVFLTGIMLCNMWTKNKENLLPYSLRKLNFDGSKDTPLECVKSYMRGQGVDETKFDELMGNSLTMGYITYDPVPYVGYMTLLNKNGDPLEESDLHDTIPSTRYAITYVEGNFTDKDLNRGFIMWDLSSRGYTNGIPSDKWDWDTLVLASADSYSWRQEPNRFIHQQRDDLVRRGLPVFPDLQEDLDIEQDRIDLGNRTYNNLDDIIGEMIDSGDIYADGQLVAKVDLVWD